MEFAQALEAASWAAALRRSVWVYPLVNAGHILGIALLVGAVVPMAVAHLRGSAALDGLRAYAVAGLVLAALCGGLLFAAQATEYLQSPWFLAKIALILAALVNAALHVVRPRRGYAVLSLALWPAALVAGRMIAYG